MTAVSHTLAKRPEQTWRQRMLELAGGKGAKGEAAMELFDAGVENGNSELHTAWVIARLAGWTEEEHGCAGAWNEA